MPRKGTNMKLAVEIVDPAFAKQALAQRMDKNRPISKTKVDQYVRDMREGKWQQNNGETIKFSPDGKLLDGQHRLSAIIEAQVTLGLAVARNVPIESFVTIDSGRSRTLRDVLSIEGHKNVTILAGVGRAAYNYIAGVSYGYSPTRMTIEEFITKHQHAVKCANAVTGHGSKLVSPTAMATVVFLGTHAGKYENEAKTFIEGLHIGDGLFRGDPRHTVREWFINSKGPKKSGITTELALYVITKAWNAYTDGAAYEKVSYKQGDFNRGLYINGFARGLFTDVPDLGQQAKPIVRSNLPKSLATPALKV